MRRESNNSGEKLRRSWLPALVLAVDIFPYLVPLGRNLMRSYLAVWDGIGLVLDKPEGEPRSTRIVEGLRRKS